MPPRKRATPTAPKATPSRSADAAKIFDEAGESDGDAFDLASIFATGAGAPKPIRFLGVHGHVRREYLGDEVVEFSVLTANISQDGNIAKLLALVTDIGPDLWGKIAPLSPQHATEILNKIVEMTGLHKGKLFAPLVSSPQLRAGAPATPDSAVSSG